MKGSSAVISTLQSGLAREAQLNLQYRMNTQQVRNLGVKGLKKKMDGFGDDAHFFMKKLTRRILFLEGNAGYQVAKIVEVDSITSMLQAALQLELSIVSPYEQAVQTAMQALDDTTRNLFEHLLKWHQQHVDWLEQQLRLIEALGEATYISTKV